MPYALRSVQVQRDIFCNPNRVKGKSGLTPCPQSALVFCSIKLPSRHPGLEQQSLLWARLHCGLDTNFFAKGDDYNPPRK